MAPRAYWKGFLRLSLVTCMLDLAKHIIKTKTGHFKPDKFEERYEDAMKELLRRKDKGEKIEAVHEPKSDNVINLMDALRQSVKGERKSNSRRRRATHQRKTSKRRAPAPTRYRRKTNEGQMSFVGQVLGHDDIIRLLNTNLKEEKAADKHRWLSARV